MTDKELELLMTLRSVRESLEMLEDWRSLDATLTDQELAAAIHLADRAIDKADPPLKVKHEVTVSVHVEVEMPSNTPRHVIEGMAQNAVHFEVEGVRPVRYLSTSCYTTPKF